MGKETWLNHQLLIESSKDNMEQAKKNQKEPCDEFEYDRRKYDQYHKIEMAWYQAIFN